MIKTCFAVAMSPQRWLSLLHEFQHKLLRSILESRIYLELQNRPSSLHPEPLLNFLLLPYSLVLFTLRSHYLETSCLSVHATRFPDRYAPKDDRIYPVDVTSANASHLQNSSASRLESLQLGAVFPAFLGVQRASITFKSGPVLVSVASFFGRGPQVRVRLEIRVEEIT